MDPSTKKGLSKRLGRPKRTIRVSDPFMSSENNFNDSIMSRFRFDSLSTSVNSSRTNNRGAAIGAINKEFDKMRNCNDKAKLQHKQRTRGRRVIQHTDGFKLVLEDPGVANDIFVPYNVADNIRDDTKNNNNNVNNNKNVNNKDGEQPTIVLEDYESLRAKGRSTAKDYPQSQSLNIKKYNVNDIKKNSILDAQMDPTLLLADSNKNKATRRRHEIEVERGADVSSSKRRQSIVFVEKNDNRKVGSRSKKS
ncbi:hypothetical protein PACTADRAFT_50085 [Pachysolen tannophilus NRRL Y-2460]|uniref:Uncharacterized protein n=1 Tax=Pachysolen tannophilus NRRL Y-2460 TaxID=669874 RepID=A0A1E4TUF4_PACTA|nr:hypothetical protein PACTADRAFT_50085 [Pachysolen tannophilus NRRL Y-2460]